MLHLALVIILVCFLVGAFPAWPYNRRWGYYPFSGVSLVIVVLLKTSAKLINFRKSYHLIYS